MGSNITLSAGVRQNLLSLQSTAQMMSTTQNRLATGKKVNSALDNPTNFFTSQSLGNRASDLNSLLDSIGQAQQALKAADTGLTGLTKLVESAKSIAKQAQQSARPDATYTLAAFTSNVIDPDTFGAVSHTGSVDFTTAITGAVAATASSLDIDAGAAALTALNDGDTIAVTFNGTTTTFEFDDGTVTGVSGTNVAFTDADSLETALGNAFGAGNITRSGADLFTVAGDFGHDFTVAAGAGATATSATATDVAGTTFTLSDGTNTATFGYVATGAVAADGTFTDLDDLVAAVAASSVDASGVTLTNATDSAQIDATSTPFTVGGTLGAALGFATTAYSGASTNADLAALDTETLTISVGSTAHTFTFEADTTRADLADWIDDQSWGTGVDIELDGTSGQIEVASTSSQTITIGGSAAGTLFSTANQGAHTPTAAIGTPNATRATYEAQFNDLLTQIDDMASDSLYNGINLLTGDDLKVVFNENGSSSLTIGGVTFDSAGLGLTALPADTFQDNTQIDGVLTDIDAALTSLRTQAAKFGSNLTTVQTRQEFTQNMINTLQVGADNLVLADTNEEGANLLALQTRQSLSTTALSLSAQADQAVLRLF